VPHLTSELVADVLSVKVHPYHVMKKLLPESCDVLCSHPMFGPDSGKDSWVGLPFMYHKIRVKARDLIFLIFDFFFILFFSTLCTACILCLGRTAEKIPGWGCLLCITRSG
jgi:hypothetical protein